MATTGTSLGSRSTSWCQVQNQPPKIQLAFSLRVVVVSERPHYSNWQHAIQIRQSLLQSTTLQHIRHSIEVVKIDILRWLQITMNQWLWFHTMEILDTSCTLKRPTQSMSSRVGQWRSSAVKYYTGKHIHKAGWIKIVSCCALLNEMSTIGSSMLSSLYSHKLRCLLSFQKLLELANSKFTSWYLLTEFP